MKLFCGIDAGSSYTKVVFVNGEGDLIEKHVFPTDFSASEKVKGLLKTKAPSFIVATGYGRHSLKEIFGCSVISEIKAHAIGVKRLFSEVRTIIDVGGQDSKVIKLDETGNVVEFVMNDKCAAGTGRFIEVVASRIGVSLLEFDKLAKRHTKEISLSSMCVVFAESELVSLMARGEAKENVAYAVLLSIASRISSMAGSIGVEEKVLLTGGGALISTLRTILSEKLGVDVKIHRCSQFTGALGAALYACTSFRTAVV